MVRLQLNRSAVVGNRPVVVASDIMHATAAAIGMHACRVDHNRPAVVGNGLVVVPFQEVCGTASDPGRHEPRVDLDGPAEIRDGTIVVQPLKVRVGALDPSPCVVLFGVDSHGFPRPQIPSLLNSIHRPRPYRRRRSWSSECGHCRRTTSSGPGRSRRRRCSWARRRRILQPHGRHSWRRSAAPAHRSCRTSDRRALSSCRISVEASHSPIW